MSAPAALFLLAAALAAGEPAALRHAYFQRDCAPWDGPAISFYVTAEESPCGDYREPLIGVSLNRNLPRGPKTVVLKDSDDAAIGIRCLKPAYCERAALGTFVLQSFKMGREASGRYQLRFKDGSVEEGAFKAKFCPLRVQCG